MRNTIEYIRQRVYDIKEAYKNNEWDNKTVLSVFIIGLVVGLCL